MRESTAPGIIRLSGDALKNEIARDHGVIVNGAGKIGRLSFRDRNFNRGRGSNEMRSHVAPRWAAGDGRN